MFAVFSGIKDIKDHDLSFPSLQNRRWAR